MEPSGRMGVTIAERTRPRAGESAMGPRLAPWRCRAARRPHQVRTRLGMGNGRTNRGEALLARGSEWCLATPYIAGCRRALHPRVGFFSGIAYAVKVAVRR